MSIESSKNLLQKSVSCLLAALGLGLVGAGALAAAHAPARQAAAPAPAAAVALVRLEKPAPRQVLRPKPRPKPQPATLRSRTPVRATVSLYEHSSDAGILSSQGCDAARRGVGGIVILDFGQPAYNGHTYGANLFSGAFAGNKQITRGMLGYAQGYAGCLPKASKLSITLARGTSNYHPAVPSPYKAGRKWARETMTLAHLLRAKGLDEHVASAAADDVEPAWDPSFHRTRDFFRGYRDARIGHILYNFGSLDGGVGGIWNARQVFFVASGMRYARVIPEIYNHTMAKQWAQLAHIARHRYHRPVKFAGVMTTHTSSNRGMIPPVAHKSLVRALASVGEQASVPPTATNIRSAY